jgi:hypothetical protein
MACSHQSNVSAQIERVGFVGLSICQGVKCVRMYL